MHTMRFDPADGSTPTQATVKTGTLAAPPQENPQRPGFRFDGWTLDGQPFDFQTPILQDTTLAAKWTKPTDWTLSPDHGPATGARLAINPPDRQEPYYIRLQTAGEQTVGLTGDGRIYTWTQNNIPEQVPFPIQADDGFHYLQAAAGSLSQAALGSDQHIYTWTNQQPKPVILHPSTNIQFTSISMNGGRLIAVDQQGRVHAFQDDQDESRNPTPKLAEQATTSLPEQAQAVLAVASGSRTLALDSDRQGWIWDTTNNEETKPISIKQDPGIRIIQAQALSKGFLLLDADGQAYYQAGNTASMTPVSLPDGVQTSRIAANGDQTMITGKDGHVWARKPGKTPTRADNGKQRYMQAVRIGSRITAVNRQGSLYQWNLDDQGQLSKPDRFNTTQAPTLESASMDGQPLTLTKNNDSWQADTPARQPGQTTILIVGRQDSQPFTRSLNYTVDQTLTRDGQLDSTYTVHFNTGEGGPTPQDQSIQPVYGRIHRPTPAPTRAGYQFDGWFIGQVAYDFSSAVSKDLTLTAHWTPTKQNNQWSISPDKGSQLGKETTTITPPTNTSRGIRFNQISAGKDPSYGFSLAVGSDGNAYAWGNDTYGQLGNETTNYNAQTTPVRVKTPDRNTYPDLPKDFTYLQVSAGYSHSLALGSDGYAYAWGNNDDGRLGDGTTTRRTKPVKVVKPADTPTDLTYVQVSAGHWHSLAVGSDGNTYAWGWNDQGELGNNTGGYNVYSSVPVRVRDPASPTDKSKGLQATQVSAGGDHSLAVGSDGNTYAWGCNYSGQLGSTSYSSVPVHVRDPASPTDKSKGQQATQVSAGSHDSLALGSDGYAYAWGDNGNGQLGNDSIPTGSSYQAQSSVPVPVSFNLQLVITGIRFDQTPVSGLTRGNGSSVTVTTPAHQPGTVTVSVDYTLGGAPQTPDTSLRYTYLPAGVLPNAGGEGILLALATGMTGMGGVLASRCHRKEQRSLSHASHG